ncbi:NUDIX hydrolase [Sciscionella sediminilitoris]|uniref:NUDIX hydrolase n=1 Tax=Sciscionella sediminilitoris TaxID=1445613 RepID=UPI000A6E7F32|nr:NUDIX hydrolase [Sciscionella sp. SE31]
MSGVVVDELERVLVIRRADNGHWEAPGGILEPGESFDEGVRREVAEETGMDIAVGELSGVYKNMARAVVALVFRCSPVGVTVQCTEEAAEVRWMTREEVRARMRPAFAIRVLDAFEPGTQVRTHDGVYLISGR